MIMEALHRHLSPEVILTLKIVTIELMAAGVLWALNQVLLKFRAWINSYWVLRQQVERLQHDVMILRAEIVRCQVKTETTSRPSVPPAPPPIPLTGTHLVTDDELKEGWEDDEDVTATPKNDR